MVGSLEWYFHVTAWAYVLQMPLKISSLMIIEFFMAEKFYQSWYFSFDQTCLDTYYFIFIYKKYCDSFKYKQAYHGKEKNKTCIIKEEILRAICLFQILKQIYLSNGTY